MKLTYWYAECLDDNDCYSIRAKTKKEALRQIEETNKDYERSIYAPSFGPVEKIILSYEDAFDLMSACEGTEARSSSLQIN